MRVTADGARHRSDSATGVAPAKYSLFIIMTISRCLFSVKLLPPLLAWELTSHANLATAKTRSV